MNQPYATLTLASALREMFGVQLYKNNARALLSRILSILNLDWLQHARSVRGVYEVSVRNIKLQNFMILPTYTDFDHRYLVRMSHNALSSVEIHCFLLINSCNSTWCIACQMCTFKLYGMKSWSRTGIVAVYYSWIVNLTHQLFLFIYINLWTGFFSSNVISVWDTGRTNTIFKGAVTRQWPY